VSGFAEVAVIATPATGDLQILRVLVDTPPPAHPAAGICVTASPEGRKVSTATRRLVQGKGIAETSPSRVPEIAETILE